MVNFGDLLLSQMKCIDLGFLSDGHQFPCQSKAFNRRPAIYWLSDKKIQVPEMPLSYNSPGFSSKFHSDLHLEQIHSSPPKMFKTPLMVNHA